jgi:ribosomal protein S18 acetylase RimI-like enzyme
MTENLNFSVRQMLLSDIRAALDLSIAEGWNQTEKDWRLLFDNPSNICLVAESNQRIIGTATAINYSNIAAWIGMVLVDNEFRRQGVGRTMVANIIENLAGFKSVKLDATPAGQPVYHKLGFIEEHVLFRMTNPSFRSFDKEKFDLVPKPLHPKNLVEIIKFDKNVFGADRIYLLKTILHNNPGKAFLLKQNARISGYIMGRIGVRSNYIGPVFALSTHEAEVLISEALKSLNNQPVTLDVHEDKIELIKWLESIGFIRQRQFVRMYLKYNPFPGQVENQYLIIGPEYG